MGSINIAFSTIFHCSCMATRAAEKEKPIEIGKSNLTRNSSISDVIRVWNLSPENVTASKTIFQVKNAIKNYVRTLPV